MNEAPERITASYTNWRGETEDRSITPMEIRFDATEWHPEPQWLLKAWDDDRQAWRDFALKDFNFRTDLSAAKVAAAYEDMATYWQRRGDDGHGAPYMAPSIARGRTPADAQAALDARDERVRRAERERCVRIINRAREEGETDLRGIRAAIMEGKG